MRRPAPPCDRCGRPLELLADAVVVLRFDHRDVLVEAGVWHRACADVRPEPGERVETSTASALLSGGQWSARLTELARLHEGASARRVTRKVERLAALAA